jgi:hypothetical protein
VRTWELAPCFVTQWLNLPVDFTENSTALLRTPYLPHTSQGKKAGTTKRQTTAQRAYPTNNGVYPLSQVLTRRFTPRRSEVSTALLTPVEVGVGAIDIENQLTVHQPHRSVLYINFTDQCAVIQDDLNQFFRTFSAFMHGVRLHPPPSTSTAKERLFGPFARRTG